MEQCAALLGLPASRPLARLVDLHAPVGESECEFWRRKASERAQTINTLMGEVRSLGERVAELEGVEQ